MNDRPRKRLFGSDDLAVTANCWRRGPDGSIAIYEIVQRSKWQRVYEHEGSEALTDQQAHSVAVSMVQQLVETLYPRLLYAIKSAQGIDPDHPTSAQNADLLFSMTDGTDVAWASESDMSDLAAELDERELTDTLTNWRPVKLRQMGRSVVRILGKRLSRPVFALTSAVVALDFTRGLVATRSGSLYRLVEPESGLAHPELVLVLSKILASQAHAEILWPRPHDNRPVVKASGTCPSCRERLVTSLVRKAVTCACGRASLDVGDGTIRVDGELVDLTVNERGRPMGNAPRDGRYIRAFWQHGECLAAWDSDAQVWRDADGTRTWQSKELVGWIPWLS